MGWMKQKMEKRNKQMSEGMFASKMKACATTVVTPRYNVLVGGRMVAFGLTMDECMSMLDTGVTLVPVKQV